ncbi:MAG: hypothetical protein JWM93_2116 [Frankiales bacterium]|nr:hypothetical protein [Frankiales bacterium]
MCSTAGCFEDAACSCAELTDTGADDGLARNDDALSAGDRGAPGVDGPTAGDDEAPYAWADKEELRLVVRHLRIDDLLATVPAHRIVSVLLEEPPSPRVVAVASAMLAMPAAARRQSDWRPCVDAELLTAWQRIDSWVASQLDRAIVDVAGLSPATVEDWEREEAALALRLAPRSAVAIVRRARARCGELRRVGAALADGTLLATQANGLTDAIALLDAEVVDKVLDRVLPVAGAETRATLEKLTQRAIIEADADGAAARHEKAKADRGVCVIAQPEGMVDVVLRCTAPEGERLFREVDALARRNRLPGQLLDDSRADAFLSLMLERTGVSFAESRVDLRVTMTEDAYLGRSDAPAMLDQYGPITAQAARDLINAHTTLRIAITDAASGGLRHLSSPSRLASGRLAEHVVSRDLTCRMLGCNRPAERCDLDHTVRHPDGGPTCACNLVHSKHHPRHTCHESAIRGAAADRELGQVVA